MWEPSRDLLGGVQGPDGQFMPSDSMPWMDFGDWIGVEVGYALNVRPRWAVGGSVALETGNESSRVLVRARFRRWLGTRFYAEVLPGVFVQERDLRYRSGDKLERHKGLSAEVRTGLTDVLFASARFDAFDAGPVTTSPSPSGRVLFHPAGRAHAFSVGGGIEGRTAILSTVAALLVGSVLALVGGGPIA